MNLHDSLNLLGPAILTGLGWMIRRLWVKYERALNQVELQRNARFTDELAQIKTVIASLHNLVALEGRERQAMRDFMLKWAQSLKGDFSTQLKLSQGDIEELREVCHTLVKFFSIGESSDKSTATQIGKDIFLVHKKSTGEK